LMDELETPAQAAVRAEARVARAAEREAVYAAAAPARAAEAKARAERRHADNAIQTCQDRLNERYRLTGGVSFEFGGTNYGSKGYGGLVVGIGTAHSGPIRFKCALDNRSGSWTITAAKVTAR
ncbi:hypothetical protein LCGC14_2959290, partial [marine sediment metagenome]